jgi:hypothetical protein
VFLASPALHFGGGGGGGGSYLESYMREEEEEEEFITIGNWYDVFCILKSWRPRFLIFWV